MKPILLPLLLAATLANLDLTVRAQNAPPPATLEGDLRAVLESFRSDMNTFKIRTLNEVMGLTGEEAERFWPIYRQYEKDLAAVGDRKVALIREFLTLRQAGTLDAKAWEALTRRWLENLQDRVDLWKSYQRKISRGVSPMRAAQFLQVEHQIALLIDLSVASEMPTLGAPAP